MGHDSTPDADANANADADANANANADVNEDGDEREGTERESTSTANATPASTVRSDAAIETSTSTKANADATANAVAIRCTNVRHEFGEAAPRALFRSGSERTVTALRDVSLEIGAGEVVGIEGPSGSGKSTLLHALGGLLAPTAGSVEVLGTDLATLSTSERTRHRREHVGFVFQGFHLLPSLSARANVALPLVQAGVSRRERRRRATDLLERVGLEDRLAHRPGQLSGGEQQRVAIARALVTDPDVLLADEPTGELDTETGSRVLELLVDVAADRTVVLASHDDRALSVADRVIEVLDGTVVDDGR